MTRHVEHVTGQSNTFVNGSLSTSLIFRSLLKCVAVPVLILGVADVLAASDAQSALQGVWRGQLGNNAITACFNPDSDENGSYYYNRHLVPIQLSPSQVPGEWSESVKGIATIGKWNIATSSDTAIAGTWRSSKGGDALPIALQRVEPAQTSKDCGSDAFASPLETTNSVTTVEKLSENGHPYTVITKAGQKTLVLSENGSASIRKVNEAIAKIAYNPDGVKTFNKERRESLAGDGRPDTSEILISPMYWSAHWLTVQFYQWPVGCGSKCINWVTHTWNLDTGEEVDPWSWVGSQSKLEAWLTANTQLTAECAEQKSGHGPLEFSFNEKGITLMEHPTGSDCDLEYFLPWQVAKPMLSAKGKAAFASLQVK